MDPCGGCHSLIAAYQLGWLGVAPGGPPSNSRELGVDLTENCVLAHGIEGVRKVDFEKGLLAVMLVKFGPFSARVNSCIYSELAGHSHLERLKELLGVFFGCVTQALAHDTPQDFSDCNWSDASLGFFQREQLSPGKVFSKLGSGTALCEQLDNLGEPQKSCLFASMTLSSPS